jgi:uncharacterized membrane protein (UPF0127 family)
LSRSTEVGGTLGAMAASMGAWLICEGTPVALEVASTARARRRGLLGRDGIGGVLLLSPARGVHTFRMRFAIDVAYLDRDLLVLAVETLVPNRVGRRARGTRQILEAQAGCFCEWGLERGVQLVVPTSESGL